MKITFRKSVSVGNLLKRTFLSIDLLWWERLLPSQMNPTEKMAFILTNLRSQAFYLGCLEKHYLLAVWQWVRIPFKIILFHEKRPSFVLYFYYYILLCEKHFRKLVLIFWISVSTLGEKSSILCKSLRNVIFHKITKNANWEIWKCKAIFL